MNQILSIFSVNKFIQCTINKVERVEECCCWIQNRGSKVLFQYFLNDKDCLFELQGINYRIDIEIEKEYFDKYEVETNFQDQKQNICCNIQARLFEMIECNLVLHHKHLFFESHILSLIFYSQKEVEAMQISCESCSIMTQPLEYEKIQKAKEYILANLHLPLTIPIIAGFLGTNQCYLKKGFKELVGKTVFEFVQENRMIKAHYLLQKAEIPLSDVIEAVGYSSASSFSQAFKNYFGYSPSRIERSFIPVS